MGVSINVGNYLIVQKRRRCFAVKLLRVNIATSPAQHIRGGAWLRANATRLAFMKIEITRAANARFSLLNVCASSRVRRRRLNLIGD